MADSTPGAVPEFRMVTLVVRKTIPATPERLFAAWTEPEQLTRWWGPGGFSCPAAEVDLRPGGIFRTVMRSPEGQVINNVGCFLEIATNRRLVWTIALQPGFRPSDPSFDVPTFTAVISIEPHGRGTRYTALAMHKDEASRNTHDRMGFSEGWGTALDQLVAYARTI